METVEYMSRKGRERHHFYTTEEAAELGIPFIEDWRDVEREGQWILTDDSMVVEVLKIGQMRTGTVWLRTANGSFLTSSGTQLTTTPRESRFTFNGIKPIHQPFRVTERMRQWVVLFAKGRDPVKSYLEIFRGSSHRHAERRVFALMKEPEVKELVREEVSEALKQAGINEGYVLGRVKNMAEDEDVTDNVRYKCLNLLADIVELKPEQKSDPNYIGGFSGFGSVIDAVESGKQLGGNPAAARDAAALPPAVETLEEDYNEDE